MDEGINNDRIERYIYQATRLLPKKTRGDIEKELRTLINDMIEERCGDKEPAQKDIDIVLIELGDPSELAAKYADKNRYLIGPVLFPKYWMVLKIVLLCVAVGVSIAVIVGALTDPVSPWELIADWAVSIMSSLFGAFTWVTMVFAIVENREALKQNKILGEAVTEIEQEIEYEFGKGKPSGSFLESLPTVPKKRAVIERGDPIAGIVFSVIWIIVLISAPQVLGIYMGNGIGRATTIFDLDVLRSVTLWLVAATMLGIAREIFKLIEGRHTKRLAITTVAMDIPALLISIYVLTRDNLFNKNMLSDIAAVDADAGRDLAEIWGFVEKIPMIILAIVVAGFVLEMAIAVYKGVKYD
jgi:hypothetical protein